MSDDNPEDDGDDESDDTTYKLKAKIGDAKVEAKAEDQEWVENVFDDKLDEIERLYEMTQDADKHHVSAGAGWLMADATAESPEEAMAIWLDMWERMIEDTKELEDTERRRSGITHSR